MKVDHIGIAVSNIEDTAKSYKDILGLEPSEKEHLENQMIDLIVFVVGGVEVELLAGTDEKSPISKFLKDKAKDTIHHIAFGVPDLNEKMAELTKKGFSLVEGYPKKGKDGSLIAFLHPKSTGGVLIELVEKK